MPDHKGTTHELRMDSMGPGEGSTYLSSDVSFFLLYIKIRDTFGQAKILSLCFSNRETMDTEETKAQRLSELQKSLNSFQANSIESVIESDRPQSTTTISGIVAPTNIKDSSQVPPLPQLEPGTPPPTTSPSLTPPPDAPPPKKRRRGRATPKGKLPTNKPEIIKTRKCRKKGDRRPCVIRPRIRKHPLALIDPVSVIKGRARCPECSKIHHDPPQLTHEEEYLTMYQAIRRKKAAKRKKRRKTSQQEVRRPMFPTSNVMNDTEMQPASKPKEVPQVAVATSNERTIEASRNAEAAGIVRATVLGGLAEELSSTVVPTVTTKKRRRARISKSSTTDDQNATSSSTTSAEALEEQNKELQRERCAHMAAQMPDKSECVLYWQVTAAVRIRSLWDAIGQILKEGMFIARPEGFILNRRYDSTKTMVAYFEMPKEKLESYGTYYCEEEIHIPLDIDEVIKAVRAINQSDVVGICVRKKMLDSAYPKLDWYVMHQDAGYCVHASITMLHEDFMDMEPVEMPKDLHAYSKISLQSQQFKKHLGDCSVHGVNLEIRDEYDRNGTLVTVFHPTDNITNLTDMSIRLFPEPNEDDDDIGGPHTNPQRTELINDHRKYSIAKLLLMAKATSLSNKVTIYRAHNFPLLLRYQIGGLGTLEYLLSSIFTEEELRSGEN